MAIRFCCGASKVRVLLSFAALAGVAQAQAAAKPFDVPAQPLADSLQAVANQAHINMIFDPPSVAGKTGPEVKEAGSAAEALTTLLAGTGLTYEFLNERTVVVEAAGMRKTGEGAESANVWNRLRKAEGEQAGAGADQGEKPVLQEIVVTAQKKEQRIQDVPMSMSTLDTQSLADTSQTRITDYYTTVPGLSVAPLPEGGLNLAIRGIVSQGTTGAQGSATTGVLIDGTPIGTGNLYVPDLDPGDLQRIEVLRGPQGTLYGASSMGGLINYITMNPSTQAMTARVQAGTNVVSNGNGAGYTLRSSINLPLTSTLAVRANAFTREDPGYIDNPYLDIQGINLQHTAGGHVSLMWTPSDALSLKLSALYQRLTADSTSDFTSTNIFTGQPLSDLQQVYSRNATAFNHQEQDYGMVLKYRVGDLTISSNTGYNLSDHHDSLDLSSALGFVVPLIYKTPGVQAWTLDYDFNFRSFSEELRFAKPLGRLLDAQLSLYWNYSDLYPGISHGWAVNPLTGARFAETALFIVSPGNSVWSNLGPRQDETAVFTDLTYHVTDKLDLQVGGRESRVRQFQTESFGAYYAFGGSLTPATTPNAEEHPFTFLLSPQYKLSQDKMIYARIASGFRPGQPQPNTVVGLGAPSKVDPDKLISYEIGSKEDFFDRRLSVDLSAYYIDWRDIQLQLAGTTTGQDPNNPSVPAGINYQYTANAGAAKSEGVDLSVQTRPLPGLSVTGWIAYEDAKVTSFPANAVGFEAKPGDRLPLSAEMAGAVSVNQEFPMSTSMRGSVGLSASYVGGRESYFSNTSARTYLPAYVKLDLTAGLNFGPWMVSLYGNNIADRRGVISGGLGNAVTNSFYYLAPRTIGLAVSRNFE